MDTEMNSNSRQQISSSQSENFILYKWRWYVLAVVSLLNTANSAVWISIAPVANYAAVLFDKTVDQINYFSLVYLIATIPFGLIAMVVTDKAGLKTGVLIGACLNAIGATIRAISTLHFVPDDQMFWIAMLGQTISGIAQGFLLIIPTKVAELWFPNRQRAIATSIVGMANPIGIIVGMLIPSVMVNSAQDIRLVNIIIAIPCIVAAVLALAGIRSSGPPTPPSYSATVEVNHAYLTNIKLLGGNKSYIILAITLGAGLGGISALMTVLQSFLCSRSYTDTFTGYCGTLLIASGIIGAGISGTIVDKTKLFTEVTKVCFCLTSLSTIFFSAIVVQHDQRVLVALSCALIGFFGFAAYPIGLELGIECSYPVPEATSSGIVVVLGQAFGLGLVQFFNVLRQPLSPYDMQFAECFVPGASHTQIANQIKPYDMTVPGLAFAGFLSFISIILVIFFKTDYKRMKAEENKAQSTHATINSIASQSSFSDSGSHHAIFS